MAGRILITGTNSGCGKTTVTTALLSAFKAAGRNISAYKCGPDYIDPMFHREALGIPSRNLDPYFCDREQLRAMVAKTDDLVVMEGVMGYYDGIGTDGRASTYTVASATESPAILVINAKGMYTSAAAIIKGFREFRENSGIKGVIFNGVSSMVYNSGLKQIAIDAGVQPLGCLPNAPEVTVGSRHLGLITAAEIEDLQDRLRKLGELAAKNLDLEGIIALAETAPVLPKVPEASEKKYNVRIGIARDEAFCFIYHENIELWESMGAEMVEFSPLHDKCLPEGLDGLYLPGGYPELYIPQLSENITMRESIKSAIDAGLPTIAECGGFLYLHRLLDGMPMVGAIDAEANKTSRLQRFGYLELTAQEDNLLAKAGQSIRSHEFHYYDSTDYGAGFMSVKASNGKTLPCCHVSDSLYAGFPHLYFNANPEFARSFLEKASAYTSR